MEGLAPGPPCHVGPPRGSPALVTTPDHSGLKQRPFLYFSRLWVRSSGLAQWGWLVSAPRLPPGAGASGIISSAACLARLQTWRRPRPGAPAAVPRLRPPFPSVRLGVCPSSELPRQHRPASRGAARAPRTCTQALPGLPRASAGGAAVSAALLVWWGHRPGPRRSWPFRGSCLETRDCGLPSPVPRCARSRPVMAPSSGLTSRVVVCNRCTCG